VLILVDGLTEGGSSCKGKSHSQNLSVCYDDEATILKAQIRFVLLGDIFVQDVVGYIEILAK
jgi:hypothetical protein